MALHFRDLLVLVVKDVEAAADGNQFALFGAMAGMARRAVPARVVAGGTNVGVTLAIEGVAPLHAARTSQRDVPTTLNTYPASCRHNATICA